MSALLGSRLYRWVGPGCGEKVRVGRRAQGARGAPLSGRSGAGGGSPRWFRWRFRPWAGTRGKRKGAGRPREPRGANLRGCLPSGGPLGDAHQLLPRKRLKPPVSRRWGQPFGYMGAGGKLSEQRGSCAQLSEVQLGGGGPREEGPRGKWALILSTGARGVGSLAGAWRLGPPGDLLDAIPPHPFGYPRGRRGGQI